MKGVYVEKNMFTSLDRSDPIILYDYYTISFRVVQFRVVFDRVGNRKNCSEIPT